MRKALIVDGAVTQVLEADPFPPFHPSLIWVECPNTVLPGYLWDGFYFREPVPDPSIPVCMALLMEPVSQLLTMGGVELNDSRRFMDFTGIRELRVQFKGSLSVRIEFSTDLGSTWDTLVPESGYIGNNPYVSDWISVPDGAKTTQDTLLRAIGIGTGLLTTVTFVEMQYR